VKMVQHNKRKFVLIAGPRRFVVLGAGCVYIYKSEMEQKYERATSLFGYDRLEFENYDTCQSCNKHTERSRESRS
jgi:hypothetical protein